MVISAHNHFADSRAGKRAILTRLPYSLLIAWLPWGVKSMKEASIYIVERDAWSTVRKCNVQFRLAYEREFLPIQNLWSDFLVSSEETGSTLAAPHL
jgi:hypothetical protein